MTQSTNTYMLHMMTSSNGKIFPRYWPFVWEIHRSPVNSPHKGQWRGALMFSLICVWTNGWVNNREAGDLRRHRYHYEVIVMNRPECAELQVAHIQLRLLSIWNYTVYRTYFWVIGKWFVLTMRLLRTSSYLLQISCLHLPQWKPNGDNGYKMFA